ncbi:Peptidoglycan-binding Lysin subgroup [Corchorus olitorius]|uniref:Peptidoglycan-binding Lysin subgroup n=1 Tax=Corchorus olitorius TaxID=93759 RepID=A0A1R3KLA6_9ROSI|nr:Peptidoglycan-binding Lysin subgroup [Corchorus olitorius]
MANSNNKVAMFLNLFLLLSLLLIINMAESRILDIGFGKASKPDCVKVHGAEEGETCFSISQAFNLTADFFNQINPNITCDKIFVGQWLCVNGTLN